MLQLFVLICMHIEQLLKCIAMCEFKGGKIDKYKWPCWIYTKDPISSMMSHEVGNISCNCDCKFYSLASHSVSNDHCLRLLDTTIWSKYCEGGILAAWDRNVERSNQDVEKKQTAGWQLRTNLTTSICRVFSSAWKSSIRSFVITEKAPTTAFSWLKAATTAFTFKTLC